MPVTRFVRPAEWPAAPAWRSLGLISVAPFLRGEPLPPSVPFTHLRVDESIAPSRVIERRLDQHEAM